MQCSQDCRTPIFSGEWVTLRVSRNWDQALKNLLSISALTAYVSDLCFLFYIQNVLAQLHFPSNILHNQANSSLVSVGRYLPSLSSPVGKASHPLAPSLWPAGLSLAHTATCHTASSSLGKSNLDRLTLFQGTAVPWLGPRIQHVWLQKYF